MKTFYLSSDQHKDSFSLKSFRDMHVNHQSASHI